MKVQNKEDILLRLRTHRQALKNFGLDQIGLFGSFVRGQQKRDSDVDLLVEFDKDKKTFRNFMGMASYIESLLGRKTEVVTPESLSPHIAPHIKRETEYVQIGN